MILAAGFLLGALATDGSAPAQLDCRRQAWLVVPSPVRGLKCYSVAGRPEATADITEPYPATASLAAIKAGLHKQGWMPLAEDFLNPGVPSSHERGFTFFQDDTVTPEADVQQWLGQWEDRGLNVVVYAIQYRAGRGQPVGQPPGRFTTTYFNCATVEQLLHETGQLPQGRRRCGVTP